MAQVEVGQPVPEFRLPASNGREVGLSDFRGKKLVLYFYPKDDTPTCTQESCDFRDYNGRFAEHGIDVVGISPDSVKAHGKFIGKYGLPFLLLADEDRAVCELFGVWTMKSLFGKKYMGVERSTFLIDENGVLAREWRKVKVRGHIREVLEAAKAL